MTEDDYLKICKHIIDKVNSIAPSNAYKLVLVNQLDYCCIGGQFKNGKIIKYNNYSANSATSLFKLMHERCYISKSPLWTPVDEVLNVLQQMFMQSPEVLKVEIDLNDIE